MFKAICALISVAVLTACCGFKMRGALTVPDYLKTVYITPNEPYEPVQYAVRSCLKDNHVKIINRATDDVTVLQLSRLTSDSQPLAFGSSGEVQRFKLSVTVSYTLTVKGKSKMQIQRSITRSRELNRSNNLLLSNEGQDQIVKKELLNEAVSAILRQITAAQHNDDHP